MSGPDRSELILASASPRRAEILRDAGVEFEVAPANIDEGFFFSGRAVGSSLSELDEVGMDSGRAVDSSSSELEKLVNQLALAKAQAVVVDHAGRLVLGADTIVVLDGEVLGKPGSPGQARQMLSRLNGRSHVVITGVAVIGQSGNTHVDCTRTEVTFRTLNGSEIDEYVATGVPFDRAGGYGIQDRPFAPVERYDGCYLNVVGLPMCITGTLLTNSGYAGSPISACDGHSRRGGDQRGASR